MNIVIVSGGFDPLHSGHLQYFQEAKKLGDRLIVGVNSDAWLKRKKGRFFLPLSERSQIVNALNMVDDVVAFDDNYDLDNSCKKFIEDTCRNYSKHEVIFANGGDRDSCNIPEMEVKAKNLSFEFGVGGKDKLNSSSWILKEWKNPVVTRKWGSYTVLDKNGTWCVKELSFDIGKSLSDQRHFQRDEHWHVIQGRIQMLLEHPSGMFSTHYLKAGQSVNIPAGVWHKATNIGDDTAKVIEVWQGSQLLEEDIERRP